jgi:uncharacterized protein Yka (UPF0111/DUF47 family)
VSRVLLLALLALSACSGNRDALEARLSVVNARIDAATLKAKRMESVLEDVRRLTEEVSRGVREVPEAAAQIEAATPLAPRVEAPLPPLPPPGSFESRDVAKLRAELARSELTLAELQKIAAEVDALEHTRDRLVRALDVIEGLR